MLYHFLTHLQSGLCHFSNIETQLVRDRLCAPHTAKFLLESWHKPTKKSYNFYINKWNTFCLIKGFHKVNALEMQVCEFIGEMSEAGYSYGAINTARCGLSVILRKSPTGETMGRRYWVSRAVR